MGRILKKNIERNKNSRYGNDKTISISKMRYNPQGTGASSESLTNYKVIRIGDVAFEGHTNREFQYGRFVVNDLGDGIMSPRFSVLRPVGPFNISYWKQYLHCERYINRILVRSTKAGTMMNELVYNDLSKEFVYCPSNNEQQKIGKLLSKVDFAITLHEEKKHQLERLKSALLQKMFADKNGYPSIRFREFSGEWQLKKFKEVYAKSNEKNTRYGIQKIISVANMHYSKNASIRSVEYLKTYNVFKVGDIAFEGNKSSRFSHGRFVENTIGDGIVSHVFDVFRPIAKHDLQFMKYYINCEYVMGPIMLRVTKASTMMTKRPYNLMCKDEQFLKVNQNWV